MAGKYVCILLQQRRANKGNNSLDEVKLSRKSNMEQFDLKWIRIIEQVFANPSCRSVHRVPVFKSRDRGPVPYPDFLRPESYRSAATLTLAWGKWRLDCWVTRIRPQMCPSFCGTIKIPPCLKVVRAVNIRLTATILHQQQWGLHIQWYIQNNQSINRLICFD